MAVDQAGQQGRPWVLRKVELRWDRSAGRLRNVLHDEWQVSDRRYLSEGSMAKINPTSDTGIVAAIGVGD